MRRRTGASWNLTPANGRRSARGAPALECWSAGCASGEEPYTLALQWRMALAARFPQLAFRVLGTDVDPVLLERARAACYGAGSVEGLPAPWRAEAFARKDKLMCLRPEYRAGVTLARLESRLRVGGALVLGMHERLPASAAAFEPWPGCRAVFRLKG